GRARLSERGVPLRAVRVEAVSPPDPGLEGVPGVNHRGGRGPGGPRTAGQAARQPGSARRPPPNPRLLLSGPRLRAAAPQQKRRSFYESDCQGRTRSLLIARASFPWQSAPSPVGALIAAGAFGCARQSASASVTSSSTL